MSETALSKHKISTGYLHELFTISNIVDIFQIY